MKMPWHGKTGLARPTAILATLLLVSSGLCGANYVAVIGSQSRQTPGWLGGLLIATGIAELLGIAVGLVGLVCVAVIAIFRAVFNGKITPPDEGN
jgi:hypothetical protein